MTAPPCRRCAGSGPCGRRGGFRPQQQAHLDGAVAAGCAGLSSVAPGKGGHRGQPRRRLLAWPISRDAPAPRRRRRGDRPGVGGRAAVPHRHQHGAARHPGLGAQEQRARPPRAPGRFSDRGACLHRSRGRALAARRIRRVCARSAGCAIRRTARGCPLRLPPRFPAGSPAPCRNQLREAAGARAERASNDVSAPHARARSAKWEATESTAKLAA